MLSGGMDCFSALGGFQSLFYRFHSEWGCPLNVVQTRVWVSGLEALVFTNVMMTLDSHFLCLSPFCLRIASLLGGLQYSRFYVIMIQNTIPEVLPFFNFEQTLLAASLQRLQDRTASGAR